MVGIHPMCVDLIMTGTLSSPLTEISSYILQLCQTVERQKGIRSIDFYSISSLLVLKRKNINVRKRCLAQHYYG